MWPNFKWVANKSRCDHADTSIANKLKRETDKETNHQKNDSKRWSGLLPSHTQTNGQKSFATAGPDRLSNERARRLASKAAEAQMDEAAPDKQIDHGDMKRQTAKNKQITDLAREEIREEMSSQRKQLASQRAS